jgi:hypothetical protein
MRLKSIAVTIAALAALGTAGCTKPKSSAPPDETTAAPDEPVSYDINAAANAADSIAPGTSEPTQASASDSDQIARKRHGRGNR